MLSSFYDFILHLFSTIDYWAVFAMMTIEASFIPFPSEIPMLAVGIQSAQGTMHPVVGLLVALMGVWIGTTINYLIGYYIGDAFVERFGKYVYIKKKDYHHAQALFQEDANFYTFFGRLIPVVRQLISIPAGMSHMPYGRFISLSLLGSAIWLSILIALGYLIGDNQELISTYIGRISLICIVCALAVWLWRHRAKKIAARTSR
jgi:membrane protein DedA with SNARE-associated domain